MRPILLMIILCGCTADPIIKVKPAFPPASLYAEDGACKHAPEKRGDVGVLIDNFIIERNRLDDCLADRAAIRKWRLDNEP